MKKYVACVLLLCVQLSQARVREKYAIGSPAKSLQSIGMARLNDYQYPHHSNATPSAKSDHGMHEDARVNLGGKQISSKNH